MTRVTRSRVTKEAAQKEQTRIRDIANTLFNEPKFVEWAGDILVRCGFFDSREATPYWQGVRGGIVKEIERLLEYADDGDKHLARMFKEQILAKRAY